jgi:predicted transposase YbfD/YdcC
MAKEFAARPRGRTAGPDAATKEEHWAIEDGLHRLTDMMRRDNEPRIRKDHAPANFTTLKRL